MRSRSRVYLPFEQHDHSAYGDSDLLFGKLDYQVNERNSISASFNYMDWISPNGIQSQAVLTNNNLASNNANSTVRTRYGRLAWTAVPSSTMVNELRFGWFKDRLYDEVNPAFIPASTGLLGVTVASTPVGTATDYPRLNPSENRYQIADNLSQNLGKHALKFGVDIMSTQDYQRILRNQSGSYSYGNFQAFALDFNNVRSATGLPNYQQYTHTFGNPILDFTTKDYGFYIQDQYRTTPKLTLNFGLRYEYTQIPQPKLVNPDYPQTGKINSPTKNFAPRVSLSYGFNDKTVVRAGLWRVLRALPRGCDSDAELLKRRVPAFRHRDADDAGSADLPEPSHQLAGPSARAA
jgi:outer membrane receptor protein involved in Fe transport